MLNHQDVITKPSKHEKKNLNLHGYIFMHAKTCITTKKSNRPKNLTKMWAAHTERPRNIVIVLLITEVTEDT